MRITSYVRFVNRRTLRVKIGKTTNHHIRWKLYYALYFFFLLKMFSLINKNDN